MVLEPLFAISIVMGGLITHVGDNAKEKDIAALVDDREHIAVLVIEAASAVDGHDHLIRLQNGDLITFPALEKGDAELQVPSAVPSLQKHLIGGKVDDKVKYGKPHAEVMAYLKYPKGTLNVHSWHKYMATGAGEERCVAKSTRFDATGTVTGRLTVKIENDANANGSNAKATSTVEVPLKPDATLYLLNATLSDHAGHFQKYRNLATTATGIHAITVGPPCNRPASSKARLPSASSVTRAGFATAAFEKFIGDHPECTNSAWP